MILDIVEPKFRVAVEPVSDRAVAVRVVGGSTAIRSGVVTDAIGRVAGLRRGLILDPTAVSFLAPSVVPALIRNAASAGTSPRPVLLLDEPSPVARRLAVTGWARQVDIHRSEEASLRAVHRSSSSDMTETIQG